MTYYYGFNSLKTTLYISTSVTSEMKSHGTTELDFTSPSSVSWTSYKSSITKVVIQSEINLTNCNYLFHGLSKLTSIEGMSNLKTSSCIKMTSMFEGCKLLTNIDLSSLDTSNCLLMNDMFYFCQKLASLDLSNFDVGKVTDMSGMFYGCSSITTIKFPTTFNTRNVTSMMTMFSECTSLKYLTLPFVTLSAKNMSDMFGGDTNLIYVDLSSFDTPKLINTEKMFYYCKRLKTIYATSSFVNSNITTSNNMFTNCVELSGGNGTKYDSSSITSVYARIDNANQKGYFSEKKYWIKKDGKWMLAKTPIYVKVDGEWKKGKLYLKKDGKWIN